MTRAALLRLAVAAVLLFAVVRLVDPSALQSALAGADHRWLAAGCVLALVSNIASALRWRLLTQWLGAAVRPLFALTTYFRAMALNALLPGAVVGGDLFRALALRQAGLPSLDAGLSVVLDRVSGLWVLLSIGAFALPFAQRHLAIALPWPPVLLDVLAVAGGVVLLVAPLALIALRLDPTGGRIAAALARLQSRLMRPQAVRQYALQMGASLVVQALSIAALAFGGRAVGLDLPAAVWIAAAAPIFLMAALPVSVGGWGTREAAAGVALVAFGVPAAQAVGAALIYGLYGLAQAALGGLMFARRSRPAAAGAR